MIDTTGNVKCPKCEHDKFDRYTKNNVVFITCGNTTPQPCNTVIGVFQDYSTQLNLISQNFERINNIINVLNQERENHFQGLDNYNQNVMRNQDR